MPTKTKMTGVTGMLLVSLTAGVVGCDDSPQAKDLQAWSQALEGIYRVDEMTKNTTSCDAKGASVLDDDRDHLAIFLADYGIARTVHVEGCASPEACRQLVTAFRARQSAATVFSYDFDQASTQALDGHSATTGFADESLGKCRDASSTTSSLVRPTDTQVRIEARSVIVDHAPDANDICWTDDTIKAAAGKPCGVLDVIEATRIESL